MSSSAVPVLQRDRRQRRTARVDHELPPCGPDALRSRAALMRVRERGCRISSFTLRAIGGRYRHDLQSLTPCAPVAKDQSLSDRIQLDPSRNIGQLQWLYRSPASTGMSRRSDFGTTGQEMYGLYAQ